MKKNVTFSIILTLILGFVILVNCQSSFSATVKGSVSSNKYRTNKVLKKAPAKKNVVNAPVNPKIKLEGNISIKNGSQLISISLRDSDVKQVLRMFADKAGLNIIFHDSVTGNITLDLVNVPLSEAFKMITQMKNLSFVIDNNTLLVMSSKEAKNSNISKQTLNTIPIKYTNAAKVAKFLNANIFGLNKPGLSNSDIVVANPKTNEILIFGTENDYKMAQKVVTMVDKKPQMTTFIVNNTTPKEMARLVCEVLFVGANARQQQQKGFKSFSAFTPVTDAQKGTGTADDPNQTKQQQQTDTGQIGGSGSSQAAQVNKVALGGGVVACQISSDTQSSNDNKGTLEAYDDNFLSIIYFPQQGTIAMQGGSNSQIAMVSEFIKKNDRKQLQALLELSVIELNEDGSKEFNNNWEIYTRFFTGSIGGNGIQTKTITDSNGNTSGQYPIFWAGGPINGLINHRWTNSSAVVQNLTYLIQNKKGRVLATPKVFITNGQTSTIDLSSDYVKTVKSEILSNSLVGAVQKTYEIGEENGIKISLESFISHDGHVTMNIIPKYAVIKEQIYDTNGAGKKDLAATLLQRRNLNIKNLRIKDGDTVVIGGMIQEQESQNTTKTPILGDIPVLGMFFRASSKAVMQSELVITITPHIINDVEIGKDSSVNL